MRPVWLTLAPPRSMGESPKPALMVDRTGVEPVTPAFSGPAETANLRELREYCEHFSNGPKKRDDDPPSDPGNPEVDFHGEKRSNKTHQSTTDPEALLAKKGKGK